MAFTDDGKGPGTSATRQFDVDISDKSSHELDFGNVSVRDGATAVVRILSKSLPVVARPGETSCGCVTIEPGSGESSKTLKVNVAPSTIADRFQQHVTLYPMGDFVPFRITIKAKVVGLVRLSASSLRFEGNLSQRLEVVSSDGASAIRNVEPLRGILIVDELDTTGSGADVVFRSLIDSGQAFEVLRITYTRGKVNETVDFTVGVSAKKDFSFVPSAAVAKELRRDQESVYTLIVYGDVTKLTESSPEVFVETKANEEYKSVPADQMGRFTAERVGTRVYRIRIAAMKTESVASIKIKIGERSFLLPVIGEKND